MFHARRVAIIGLVAPVFLFGCARSPTAPDPTNTGANTPPTLDILMTTSDPADTILVSSQPANYPTWVRLCLTVTSTSGWWKGIGVDQTQPTIQGSSADGEQCTNVGPEVVSLTFWKAKAFGIHTEVGTGAIDLTQYAGNTVTFSWSSD